MFFLKAQNQLKEVLKNHLNQLQWPLKNQEDQNNVYTSFIKFSSRNYYVICSCEACSTEQSEVVLRAQTAKRLQGWQSGLMREPANNFSKSCIKRYGASPYCQKMICEANKCEALFLATCLLEKGRKLVSERMREFESRPLRDTFFKRCNKMYGVKPYCFCLAETTRFRADVTKHYLRFAR